MIKRLFFKLFFFLSLTIIINAFSINLDPPSVHLKLRPGDVNSGYLVLENTGKKDSDFRVYVSDWKYLPDGSKEFLEAGSTKYSCASWLKIEKKSFSLLPEKEEKIKYSISVPHGVSGGYYCVVFFESMYGINQDNVSLLGRIGTIFYVDIIGTEKKEAVINDMKILSQTPLDDKKQQLDISFFVENKGNVRLTPYGNLVFVDKNNKVVKKENIYGINTLPGDSIEKVYTVNLPKGTYDAFLTLDCGDENIISEKVHITDDQKGYRRKSEIKQRINIDKLTVLQSQKRQVKVFTRISNIGTHKEEIDVALNIYRGKRLIERIPMARNVILPPNSQKLFKGIGNRKLSPNNNYKTELNIETDDEIIIGEIDLEIK